MITYWFIKMADSNWNRTPYQNTAVNNYAPWNVKLKDFYTKNIPSPFEDYFEGRGKNFPWGYVPPQLTGIGREEAQAKTIFKDTPVSADNNVMLFNTTWPHKPYNREFFLKCLPKEVLKWLSQHPYIRILFLQPTESWYYQQHVDELEEGYRLMREEYNLENKILLMTCTLGSGMLFKNIKFSKYISDAGSVSYNQHRILSRHSKETLLDLSEKLKNPTSFDKKILLYTHRFRAGRMLLLNMVLKTIDTNTLRYSFTNGETQDSINRSLRHYVNGGVLTEQERKEIEEITLKRPLGNVYGIDQHPAYELPDGRKEMLHRVVKRLNISTHLPNEFDYGKTFLELVSETNGEREHCWISKGVNNSKHQSVLFTEKIFKPLLARRPFIVAANAGYLQTLKDNGFKTFDRWFDESYDSIDLTLKESLEVIKKNLIFISKKSNDELMEMYQEMKPILEHNHKRILEHVIDDPRLVNIDLEKYFKKC